MPNSDPERPIVLSISNNHDRFFCLHTLWFLAFDFNVGVKINKSHSYTLTSAILKVDIISNVAMTSSLNVLTMQLHDVQYNQCIDNTCCYSFFIYPTGRIRVCKVRFVSTGENRGGPCLVCKEDLSSTSACQARRISLIRVYTVCHSFYIIWMHCCMLRPHFSKFR